MTRQGDATQGKIAMIFFQQKKQAKRPADQSNVEGMGGWTDQAPSSPIFSRGQMTQRTTAHDEMTPGAATQGEATIKGSTTMRNMATQRQTTLDQATQGKIAMILLHQKAGEMTCQSVNQSHVMGWTGQSPSSRFFDFAP